MKKVMIPIALVLVSVLFLIGLSSTANANPHRMLMIYNVGRIDLTVYFEGGTRAQNAHVTVYKPDGTLYLEGETNDEGEFSFEPTVMQGEWKVVAEHSGHIAEVTVDPTKGGGGSEMPLYTRVIAGLGYLIGLGGVAIGYMGWRARRRSESGLS